MHECKSVILYVILLYIYIILLFKCILKLQKFVHNKQQFRCFVKNLYIYKY